MLYLVTRHYTLLTRERRTWCVGSGSEAAEEIVGLGQSQVTRYAKCSFGALCICVIMSCPYRPKFLVKLRVLPKDID